MTEENKLCVEEICAVDAGVEVEEGTVVSVVLTVAGGTVLSLVPTEAEGLEAFKGLVGVGCVIVAVVGIEIRWVVVVGIICVVFVVVATWLEICFLVVCKFVDKVVVISRLCVG